MKECGNIVVIAGPTAVGKSSTAIELSKKINAEIVSADSFQCYKYMDIGTAKPTRAELEKVRHHMIDVYMPNESPGVFDYASDAKAIIEKKLAEKNIILVGGSGLYIDSIIFQNYNFEEATVDAEYRKKLQKIADECGGNVLFEMLEKCDPEYAKLTHRNNVKRVIRALEFFYSSGKRMSENKPEKKFAYKNTSYFVLGMDRNILYDRINKRVDEMMENGLVDEVSALYNEFGESASDAFKAIGYAELIAYIKGETDLYSAAELIKQHSRNYAKRQYTWFRRNPEAIWINVEESDSSETIAKKILEKINV